MPKFGNIIPFALKHTTRILSVKIILAQKHFSMGCHHRFQRLLSCSNLQLQQTFSYGDIFALRQYYLFCIDTSKCSPIQAYSVTRPDIITKQHEWKTIIYF